MATEKWSVISMAGTSFHPVTLRAAKELVEADAEEPETRLKWNEEQMWHKKVETNFFKQNFYLKGK